MIYRPTLQKYPENELQDFDVEMVHTITVRKRVKVSALDRAHAEGLVAGSWFAYPRNKKERDAVDISVSEVKFKTSPDSGFSVGDIVRTTKGCRVRRVSPSNEDTRNDDIEILETGRKWKRYGAVVGMNLRRGTKHLFLEKNLVKVS